jgi:uncharacterized membrane protein
MAGVGFRLTKYFTEKDFYKNLKGSLYSIIISSGPWLISVITIAALSIFARQNLGDKEILVFRSIINYSFAFSLILFGLIELPLTRYLADKLYINDQSSFRNVYLIVAMIFIVLCSLGGFTFYSFFDWGLDLIILCVGLLVSIILTWHSMIFLSAAKHFHQIVVSFALGALSSIVFGYAFGFYFGLVGYIGGYALGQVMLTIFLARNLFVEFPDYNYITLDVIEYFFRYKNMVFVGFFYYLGIWVDKFIFWFSDQGTHVEGLFYTSQSYDTAIFLSYLSIVPSLAVFLVNVETSFYLKYAYFFRSIQNKNDLRFIESAARDIIESFRHTFGSMIKIQAFITITLWLFADQMMQFLYLPQTLVPIFKYGLLGSFFQVLFLVLNIILLYFKESKKVLQNYTFFMVLNFSLTLIFLYIEDSIRFHGLGYLMSSFFTFMISFLSLNHTLKNLNYITFMRQPILQQVEVENI